MNTIENETSRFKIEVCIEYEESNGIDENDETKEFEYSINTVKRNIKFNTRKEITHQDKCKFIIEICDILEMTFENLIDKNVEYICIHYISYKQNKENKSGKFKFIANLEYDESSGIDNDDDETNDFKYSKNIVKKNIKFNTIMKITYQQKCRIIIKMCNMLNVPFLESIIKNNACICIKYISH